MKLRSLQPTDQRFARHDLIDGWDQDRLARLRVAVFGVGALGNEVVKNLALLGVGHLLLVDMDTIEASNLSRSVLFRNGDQGRAKVAVAAERARELWPQIEIKSVVGDLHLEVGPGLLATYDFAIACLDSIDARLGVNTLCRRAGIPWWNGGLGASACEITHFSSGEDSHSVCYACTLSAKTRAQELQRFSCQHGRPQNLPARTLPTTVVTASMGGAMLVQEALASAFPEWRDRALQQGQRILLEGSPWRLTEFEVPRDPRCLEHQTLPNTGTRTAQANHQQTGAELLAELAIPPSQAELHLDFDLVTEWSCGCTDHHAKPFIPVRSALGLCQGCSQRPEEFETTTTLSGLDSVLDRPMVELGLPDGGELLIGREHELITVRLSLVRATQRSEFNPPSSSDRLPEERRS